MKFKTTLKTSLILNFAFFFCSLSEVEAQNIGINGSGANAHPSALLDVNASSTPSLGILIPRIALQAINLAAPVTSPATSLLVYNTASISTGTNAVSAGYYYWDGTKWVRFQMANAGSSSTSWDVLGNTGTVAGTNFLGTTDNQDLVFKRNNIRAGLINSSNNNTSFGNSALNSLTTGLGFNSAFGSQALASNTAGYQNSAFGAFALGLNTGGNDNTGIGMNSLYRNTTGVNNTAIGSNIMLNNTLGNNNSAIGPYAGNSNTIGSNNVFLGYSAGLINTTGINNTFLGVFADATVGTFTNATAIGYNAKVAQSNALILGGTGANQVKVGIGTTTPNEQFTIEYGDMQFGETMPSTGLGRQLFFSDIPNNAFDPIYFQRQNISSDFSNLNLSIGDNYNVGYSNDKFNVGAGYSSGIFNSVLTVEMGQRRVGINTMSPNNALHVNGIIESNAGAGLGSNYAMLTPDGSLRLRREAIGTFSNTNGYIDFANTAGTGYDFRISFERNVGPNGSLSFGDNVNGFMNIAQVSGRVGIAAPTPGGLFELGLNEGRKPLTSTWTVVSDERLKNIDGKYTKGLKEILQLNTITYHYKNVGNRTFKDKVLNTQAVGYSAQEVQKIFPEAVGVDDDGYLNLDMHAILVAYTNAIKEQQTQIEDLKLKADKVNELQSQIELLKQQNETILKLIEKK